MKPHAFAPDPPRPSCKACGQTRGHSLHVAHEDAAGTTDGAQADRMIRGTKP
jgi:hypothetical protein